jgi:hypothetical protein
MVVLILGELAFVAFVLWLAVPFFRDRARLRAELQRAMVERFASTPELAAFLDTPAGRRFEAALGGRALPQGRILAGLQVGVVLVLLALGLAAAARIAYDKDLLMASVIVLALGVGFLGAAYASHRLCRAWGLGADAAVDAPPRPQA